MTKEPKPNWSSFTKAELIKTIKKLDARQTRLLNEIASLKTATDLRGTLERSADNLPKVRFPWE